MKQEDFNLKIVLCLQDVVESMRGTDSYGSFKMQLCRTTLQGLFDEMERDHYAAQEALAPTLIEDGGAHDS